MTPQDRQQWYEAFFQKVLAMRRNHHDKKRFIPGAGEREYRYGLEVDKMIREENLRRRDLENQVKNG